MRTLAAFLVLLGPSAAMGARGVRLTYFGDPATTIAVSWNSDDPTDQRVIYGTSPSSLTTTATATAIAQDAPLGQSFSAELTGLTPGTTYYYRVGGAGDAWHPSGDPFSFTTRSDDPCAPFRFVLIGDNRNDTGDDSNPVWEGVLAEAMAHEPAFFVNTGDMVREGATAAQWSAFVDASEAGWALVPSILTMGNHDADEIDGDGALYNQLYDLPKNSQTDTEDYYSIDVGPIHFVSLNTQYVSPGETAWTDMQRWLSADLAASTAPWKMVFFHKAVYSRGNHSTGEEENGELNRRLVPIFDAQKVDFVMNGHSHDYERYAPSRGLDPAFGGSGRAFPAGPGSGLPGILPDGDTATTYLVSGGAGALTTDVFGFTCMDAACTYCLGFNTQCDGDVLDKDREGTVVYDGRHNYAVFEVAAGMITVKVFTTEAGNGSAAAQIDEFSVMSSNASALACGAGGSDGGVGEPDGGEPGGGGGGGGVGGDGGGDSGGCGCRAGGRTGRSPLGAALAALALALALRQGFSTKRSI